MVLAIGACSKTPEASVTQTPDVLRFDPGAIAPAVRGGDNGLEVRWWVVDDQPDRIARELRPYLGQSTPLDEQTVAFWRANGIRMVAIPLADVSSIKKRLPLLGRVDRHWLGQSPRWTQLLEGEPLENPISRHGRRVELPDGRLRLLGRAWTSPAVGAQPGLRLDMSLQFIDEYRRRDPFALGLESRPLGTRGLGEIFDDLTINVELREGWAYLILPEDPAQEWSALDLDASESVYDWGEMHGPPAPPVPTLGEALLTTLGASSSQLPRNDLRAIVLLIPRLPDSYRLLPSDKNLAAR
jgi:hypothetical protein